LAEDFPANYTFGIIGSTTYQTVEAVVAQAVAIDP
jgi:hypothetical protein